MNKKLLFGMFAAATMLFATACSNELDSVQSGNESIVSFTLEQPGMATRAYSDGTTATTLTYAVYETGTQTIVYQGEGTFTDKIATINIELQTGSSYDFIFWAAAPDAPYTFNATTQTITVDYTNALSQDENRDAFFTSIKELNVNGPIQESIVLKRPFAQLNIGTKGETDAVLAALQVSVTVSNLYNTLNLLSGEVSGESQEVVFAMNNIPGPNDYFPIAGYKYLAMNYLLCDQDGDLVTVKYDVSNGVSREEANVPVARNYRTNLYGRNLTEPDAATIALTVEIVPDMEHLERDECAHEAIDLGLTSGTLWATANIGASTPESIGFYFAWGETGQEKPSYNWNSYAHYTSNGNDDSTLEEEMSKYNLNDGIKVLESTDDAATVRWGEGWSIPTKADFEELIAQCDWTWDYANKGYVIKSRTNNNSIFLPGTAYKEDGKIQGKESDDVMYWTSTLSETNTLWAEYFEDNVNDNTEKLVYSNKYLLRKCGLQIRPVKK